MERVIVFLCAMLFALGVSSKAEATIDKLAFPEFPSNVIITNTTGNSVTFVRVSETCTQGSPDSFTVAGNSSTTIKILQKYYDTGLDNCFARYHDIIYQDQNNTANSFRIVERPGTDQFFCLSVKAIGISIGICPESTGNVLGPSNAQAFDAVYCPPSIQNCRPFESAADGTPNQNFGFVIVDLPPFGVTLNNPTGNILACSLVDLNNKTDRNACVRSEPDVGSGSTPFSLPAICPNKAYRLADRTNVQLICYVNGTNAEGLQAWVPTTNGTTYTYAPTGSRPTILIAPKPKPKSKPKRP